MIPLRPHVPTNVPSGKSHKTSGGPPDGSIFLSFPSAKNASQRLSGDQTGEKAPSVPGNARADSESAGRSQRSCRPSETAIKARLRPLGEMLRLCQRTSSDKEK